jgi:hypothetical protein
MSIPMIGLDTAKSVFQLHAADAAGKVVARRKLRRSELVPFFAAQAPSTIVMEACGGAQHWARVLVRLGHDVKLLAPEAVRPFVRAGRKNDAADAAALCEAAPRPTASGSATARGAKVGPRSPDRPRRACAPPSVAFEHEHRLDYIRGAEADRDGLLVGSRPPPGCTGTPPRRHRARAWDGPMTS